VARSAGTGWNTRRVLDEGYYDEFSPHKSASQTAFPHTMWVFRFALGRGLGLVNNILLSIMSKQGLKVTYIKPSPWGEGVTK